jgi:hypothetical protein
MTLGLYLARQMHEFWSLLFITGRSHPLALGRQFSLVQRFHWLYASLRCKRVGFTRLHNPRNASKTTDPRVMAGAMEARGTERAEVGWVRFSDPCFLQECYARLSRPER